MLEMRITKNLYDYCFLILMVTLLVFGCQSDSALYSEEGIKLVNDVELFYRVIGDGEPLVVLHGGPGLDHNYLLPQMEELAKQHRLIFYDQRGTGGSSTDFDSSAITIESFVNDLEGIRKAFNLETVNLLGHSWGGLLAMYYAIKHPDKLKSLILANPMPPTSEFLGSFMANINRNRTSADSLALAEITASEQFADNSPDAVEIYLRLWFRAYFHDQALSDSLSLELVQATAANGQTISNLFFQRLLMNYNIYDQLSAVKCPTLVIHGDSDPIPLDYVRKIHETIENSHFVLLDNCGHFPYIETPKKFYSAITDFLKEDHS